MGTVSVVYNEKNKEERKDDNNVNQVNHRKEADRTQKPVEAINSA